MSEWQPIETVKCDVDVLLLDARSGNHWSDSVDYWGSPPAKATHWMPLPEPPKRTMKYTVERPKPMPEHPKMGQVYWVVSLGSPRWASRVEWINDVVERRHFNRGLCYVTEEEAVAAAKAMVGGE